MTHGNCDGMTMTNFNYFFNQIFIKKHIFALLLKISATRCINNNDDSAAVAASDENG